MSMRKSPLAVVVGTTLFSGLAISNVNAAGAANIEGASPFAMTELRSGYMQLAKADKTDKKMKDGNTR